MATEKQIAANRQNAQKSTGPNTEQGKRRSMRAGATTPSAKWLGYGYVQGCRPYKVIMEET
jgi:hypothetical protein